MIFFKFENFGLSSALDIPGGEVSDSKSSKSSQLDISAEVDILATLLSIMQKNVYQFISDAHSSCFHLIVTTQVNKEGWGIHVQLHKKKWMDNTISVGWCYLGRLLLLDGIRHVPLKQLLANKQRKKEIKTKSKERETKLEGTREGKWKKKRKHNKIPYCNVSTNS